MLHSRLDAYSAAFDVLRGRLDAVDFKESEHPRANDGKFTKGGGGGKSTTPDIEHQTKAVSGLKEYLGAIVKMTGGHPASELPLKYGRQFVATDKTFQGKKGTAKQCYKNAAVLAISDPKYTYVEGFVTVYGVPIEHAWVVDKAGNVNDPTLNDSKGIGGYFGIPIKTDYLANTLAKNKIYGVLGYTNKSIYDTPTTEFLQPGVGVKASEEEQKSQAQRVAPPPPASPATSLFEKHKTPTVTEFMGTLSARERTYLATAEEKLSKVNPTNSHVEMGGFKQSDGSWTPERTALHTKIIKTVLTREKVKAAKPKPGEQPVFTVLGGRAGSGKSFLTRPGDGPVDTSKSIKIDSDEIKAMLPEYQGWNAAAVHEEASYIVERTLRLAKQMGCNVVLDGTMKSFAPMQERLEDFKSSGYKLKGYYMFAPPAIAAKRAVNRGMKSGRYVPPSYVLSSTSNERSFDGLRDYFDGGWAVYDSSSEVGLPKLTHYGDGK